MERIANHQMSDFTTHQRTFKTNNKTVYAEYKHNRNANDDLYIVYSYGEHFPMYIYDSEVEMWFGNEDSYSPSTSKHQTLARPDVDDMTMLPTDALVDMTVLGGYRNYCAERCSSMYFISGKPFQTKPTH